MITAPGPSGGLRFLPAHASPTVPCVTPPQPTFLPKISVRRKISSPVLQSEKSGDFFGPPSPLTSGVPRFTNLADYMDELASAAPQNYAPIGQNASTKSHLLGRYETSPSSFRCLPAPSKTTPTLPATDQTSNRLFTVSIWTIITVSACVGHHEFFISPNLYLRIMQNLSTIPSHSQFTSTPPTDDAPPPPHKIKRKTLVPRIHCLDPEPTSSTFCSSATSTSFRKSLNSWRRRRSTRRDVDLHLAKHGDDIPTAEASRLSRCRLLENFAHDEVYLSIDSESLAFLACSQTSASSCLRCAKSHLPAKSSP
ncbi:unnamed protein product [Hydatigera taeniaeformis]|uniref:Uncharacterized protein n=1 Tax=Hydatigena taeniaeformis TaxID=6205 RepID=A0A0R3WTU0_HYDTA|nr:unnamed protein product [Hydatigera taeniaeformis]